jgi:hypothetical protein
MLPKPLHALAALSLVGASSAAVAQSAAPLSLAYAPAAAQPASPGEAGELHGPVLWIGGLVVLGLAIWGLTELLDDEDAFPVSP